jgi:hypothetical protein
MALASPEPGDPKKGLPLYFAPGSFVYISAQNKDDNYGDISCRISTKDGAVISENTSSGQFAIVTCQGTA